MARPRDPELDARILAAARHLLATVGYADMTIEAVARQAGGARPTVYTRWANAAQLAFEATTNATMPDPVPDTGSLVGDLSAALRALRDQLLLLDRGFLGDQLGSMIADADFAERVDHDRLRPDAQAMAVIWDRAVARGEGDPSAVDGVELFEDLAAVLLYRVLVLHRSPSDDELDALVRRTAWGLRP